jgi:quinol monooxygenase YgiN
MRFLIVLLFAGIAWAQNQVYVVTHIDLMPAGVDSGVAALKTFATETLKESGCARFEILQQAGRPNHLTLVGIWNDQKSFDVHDSSPWTKRFREKMQPLIGSPWDERLHQIVKP